jgi:hypothetical protein
MTRRGGGREARLDASFSVALWFLSRLARTNRNVILSPIIRSYHQ